MENIALLGFMGTGKTSVGLQLADTLGWNFVDTDKLIEQKNNMSIPEIFNKFGEKYFRLEERLVVAAISTEKRQVISTGGGVVLDPGNIENLRKKSRLVCLKATPEVIYERIKKDASRPLLRTVDPQKTIINLLAERELYYNCADFSVNTSYITVEEIVNQILTRLSEQGEDYVRLHKS